jgi:hypothetical protein
MHPLIATYTSDDLATEKALNSGIVSWLRYLLRTVRLSLASVKLGHPSFGGALLLPFRTPSGKIPFCVANDPRHSVRELKTKTI